MERKIKVKHRKHGSYISLGALVSHTRSSHLVGDMREAIENAENQDNRKAEELRRNVRLGKEYTDILITYKFEMKEFLKSNGFDLTPKEKAGEADKELPRREAVTGINLFLKSPIGEFNPEDYNAEVPRVRPISIYEREELTDKLMSKISGNGKVHYSATEIMKMLHVTSACLSKYLKILDPLECNNAGMPGYPSNRVLRFAEEVLRAERRKDEMTETL